MKNSTTMHDFFKRKNSNSSKVNVRLPITNVTIPILKNVDIPILENMHFPILENVNNPISQTQFEILDAYLNFFFPYLRPPSLKSWVRPCSQLPIITT